MTDLALPDTRLVTSARALVEQAAPRALLHHSIRTFLLGRAWAQKKRFAFDEEGLALAALFHDVGLVARFADRSRPFTEASSRALRLHLADQGVERARIAALTDAIELHMQLLPRFSRGPEVGLLQVGAWMDVTGLRRWTVRADARAIAAAWPREGFGLLFPRALIGSFGSVSACTGLLFRS